MHPAGPAAAVLVLLAYLPPVHGQAQNSRVLARVDDHPFTETDVDAALAAALGGRQLAGESLASARDEVLTQLIDRYLVERHVLKQFDVPPREVEAQLDHFKTQLAEQQLTLAEYLSRKRLTEVSLREQLRWQLAWQQYLAQNLTDERLQDYFEKHRANFDGTELRVSHVLLRPEQTREGPTELLKRAGELREQIASGKLTFESAVERYSAGPSREKGGDLGFISRHGAMHEAFSSAAFSLQKGELSPAVLTPFGAHLIKVTDTRPGKNTWRDVKENIKTPAARALFSEIAAAERQKAKIEFVGQPNSPSNPPDGRRAAAGVNRAPLRVPDTD